MISTWHCKVTSQSKRKLMVQAHQKFKKTLFSTLENMAFKENRPSSGPKLIHEVKYTRHRDMT